MKKIVIFGGAFDPPHLGHLLVVRQALSQIKPDQLWLLPCFGHTFGKVMAPPQDRYKMTQLLAEAMNDERVKVSEAEITRHASGSSYETWLALKEENPKSEFMFLIGSDNLASFNRWKDWKKLLKAVKFYVYLRAGYPARPWYTGMRLLHRPEVSWVSSTEVRRRLARGIGISDLVPEEVEKYIIKNQVYSRKLVSDKA